MKDSTLVQEANKRWHRSIAPSVPQNHFSSEAQSKGRREFIDSTYVEILERSTRAVQKQGYFMMFWRSPNGDKCTFKIFLKILTRDFDRGQIRCTVNFVHNGIQVTKQDGKKGLFDVTSIKGHPEGIQLLRLWGLEHERITGQYPQEAIVQTSNLTPGRPMIKLYNDNARQSFNVIQENDSITILKTLLHSFSPDRFVKRLDHNF